MQQTWSRWRTERRCIHTIRGRYTITTSLGTWCDRGEPVEGIIQPMSRSAQPISERCVDTVCKLPRSLHIPVLSSRTQRSKRQAWKMASCCSQGQYKAEGRLPLLSSKDAAQSGSPKLLQRSSHARASCTKSGNGSSRAPRADSDAHVSMADEDAVGPGSDENSQWRTSRPYGVGLEGLRYFRMDESFRGMTRADYRWGKSW